MSDASACAVLPRCVAAGAAPPIVLIHGVGFGPETLSGVARAIEAHAPVIVPPRRGYGARAHLAPGVSVAEHVDDVLLEVDRLGVERAVLVGVSGGATVALAAALTVPERVVVAVAHEPAAGSCSPELRALVRRTLEQGGGRRLVRLLAGTQTWAALAPEDAAAIDGSAALVEADAQAFLEFEPVLPPRGTRVPLVCSVGARSSPLRLAIARRLSARTVTPVAMILGCGHLAQLDAPEAFAQLILDHARAAVLAERTTSTTAAQPRKEHAR